MSSGYSLAPHAVYLLALLVERAGKDTLSGIRDHRQFDQLEKLGFISRHSVNLDSIEYVITVRGREASTG